MQFFLSILLKKSDVVEKENKRIRKEQLKKRRSMRRLILSENTKKHSSRVTDERLIKRRGGFEVLWLGNDGKVHRLGACGKIMFVVEMQCVCFNFNFSWSFGIAKKRNECVREGVSEWERKKVKSIYKRRSNWGEWRGGEKIALAENVRKIIGIIDITWKISSKTTKFFSTLFHSFHSTLSWDEYSILNWLWRTNSQ
jgi:hypothetical protein